MKSFKWTYIFLIIFWLIFWWVWFFLFFPTISLVMNWEKTNGVVIDNISSSSDWSTTYSPVVEYNVDWKKYETESNLSSSFRYDIWEEIEIFYDKNNPDKIVIDSFMNKYFWLFFFIPWLIVFSIPIFLTIKNNNRKKEIEYLKIHWKRIEWNVWLIWYKNYSVNNVSPMYFNVQVENNWKLYIYESESFWFNIREYIKEWDKIPIMIDNINNKKYYVDTNNIIPEINYK